MEEESGKYIFALKSVVKTEKREGKSFLEKEGDAGSERFNDGRRKKKSLGKFVKKSSFIKNYANCVLTKGETNFHFLQLFITFNNTFRKRPCGLVLKQRDEQNF